MTEKKPNKKNKSSSPSSPDAQKVEPQCEAAGASMSVPSAQPPDLAHFAKSIDAARLAGPDLARLAKSIDAARLAGPDLARLAKTIDAARLAGPDLAQLAKTIDAARLAGPDLAQLAKTIDAAKLAGPDLAHFAKTIDAAKLATLKTPAVDFARFANSPLVRSILEMSEPMEQLESQSRALQVQAEKIRRLETELLELNNKLAEAKGKGEEAENKAQETKTKFDELVSAVRLQYLIDRVSPEAARILVEDTEAGKFLREGFEENRFVPTFVMSIDIRRSTDLMLKARDPRLFADFVTGLCGKLKNLIVNNYGVFDKFTGDGVLAFFPDFYSGPDAGLLAVKTAVECHKAFDEYYRSRRRYFNAVMTETGLGIGIDYGYVQIVLVSGDLTIVGNPVVYACRLGSAPAGTTLVNEPAYDVLLDEFSANCEFAESSIVIKHEGGMVAYSARINEKPMRPRKPSWSLTRADPSADELSESGSPQVGPPQTSATGEPAEGKK